MPRRLRKVPPVPKPSDPNFQDWLFALREKTQGDGQIEISQLAVGTGTANQIPGIDAGATAFEFKTLQNSDGSITLTNATGTLTFTAVPAFDGHILANRVFGG